MELTSAVELTAIEARVVGSLIEKAALTPDVYPMTTNSLVAACNQKTNREPVVDYDAVTVDAALLALRERNLVRKVHSPGSRSTKHRHVIDEVVGLDDGELALICVLLLRGPQTIGELRLRAERQHEFASTDAVEVCLEALAARSMPLVRQLSRRPGQKESRWLHLLGDVDGGEPVDVSSPGQGMQTHPVPVGQDAEADVDLIARVEELEAQVATLRSQLAQLAEQLGETFD